MSYISMLIYAPAGHGKTYFLGTGAKDNRVAPMLLLDFEAGVESIRSHVKETKVEDIGNPVPGKIDVVRIKAWSDLESVYDLLLSNKSYMEKYKSVALDSLTEMNYLNLTTIVENSMATNPRHMEDVAEMSDYLRSAFMMRKIVRGFRDLPVHSFFTAGVQEVTDPVSKVPHVVPALNGKMALEVPGLVTIVGYLGIDGEKRVLLTQPASRFTAKDRTEGGKLGAYVEDPTIPKIFDLIYANHKEEAD